MFKVLVWISIGVLLPIHTNGKKTEDELIAQVEGDLLKFESLFDVPEDYFVKMEIKWASTPDSALFYESAAHIERWVSPARELEYAETTLKSENHDAVPITSGMQKNCESIIGTYKQRSMDGLLTNGKLKWFDQGLGANPKATHDCKFIREFDLPFVSRDVVMYPDSRMHFRNTRCYWAEDLGEEVVSLWTREDKIGTGFHELTFKKGLLVRHRILITKRGIKLKSKPKAKDGTPISDVKTTWNIINDHQVPVKVEAVLNDGNEIILFEADLKWEFEKRFPEVVEEGFLELKRLIGDK